MKLANIDNVCTGPLDGEPLTYAAPGEDGKPVQKPFTVRRAIGMCLLNSRPDPKDEKAPELTPESMDSVFRITRELVSNPPEKSDAINVEASDVVFLRKVGAHYLHPIAYGYLNAALKDAESN